MARFLKEPLFHFLALGAALFVVFGIVGDDAPAPPKDEIVITKAQIVRLAVLFEKTWKRAPTAEERQTLIDEYIKEEVYYREARAAGLDEDDVVVRRRMRQKLEFLVEDVGDEVVPSDDDLKKFYDEHEDAFRGQSTYTFRHVYLNPDHHKDVDADTKALLAKLRASGRDADTAELGDRLLSIEPAYADATRHEVERALGKPFAAELDQLPVGEWSGPVASGYGLHLVLLDNRTPGARLPFDQVRNIVEQEWRAAQSKKMGEDVYRELRAKYVVTVEED